MKDSKLNDLRVRLAVAEKALDARREESRRIIRLLP